MKRILWTGCLIVLSILSEITLPLSVVAHRDGCHRWHSCPSDSGSYVCGDLGNYSQCPGGAPATPSPSVSAPPPPRQPVITFNTLFQDEDIPFKDETKYTSREYPDYSKVAQEGVLGKKRTHIEVTYTDGQETSRKNTLSEVLVQPKARVIVKGNRTKPASKLISIHKTKNKNKYDVKGKYRPNEEVVLSLNDKKLKRAKTNKDGTFIFKQIEITKNDSPIKIYRRKNRKENQISEKTFVGLKKLSLTTEYDKLHKK